MDLTKSLSMTALKMEYLDRNLVKSVQIKVNCLNDRASDIQWNIHLYSKCCNRTFIPISGKLRVEWSTIMQNPRGLMIGGVIY